MASYNPQRVSVRDKLFDIIVVSSNELVIIISLTGEEEPFSHFNWKLANNVIPQYLFQCVIHLFSPGLCLFKASLNGNPSDSDPNGPDQRTSSERVGHSTLCDHSPVPFSM